jgi:hypothetical protein
MIKKDWILFALCMFGLIFLYEYNDGLYRKYLGLITFVLLLLYDLKKSNWAVVNFVKKLSYFHLVLLLLAIVEILIFFSYPRLVYLILSLIFLIVIALKKRFEG